MTLETHKFQAEVQQLLNLMIHSLYSNKEIFLRELVSNASDALDKLRFEELTKRDLLPIERENAIYIEVFPTEGRLVIEDTGIGMDRQELIDNLGTIANSGTKAFLAKMQDSDRKDSNLIGQFGVGFYSAFMVAERIVVDSRSARGTDAATRWESTGDGNYTLSESERTERGTRIEIILKEDQKEYAEHRRIREIIRRYSNYVTYPVNLKDEEGDFERLNKTTPVWARRKAENTKEDYDELYKQLTRDYNDPLAYEHFSSEGTTAFQAVLFLPEVAPFDLYTREAHGPHLYVKRVSISEKCKELLPEYLRFVAGVVETDDLPLNVSREMLQQNPKLGVIRKAAVKKVLGLIQNLAKTEPEKFKTFYSTFGPVLKEGFHFDRENHTALGEIARFRSTATGKDAWVTLDEYVERKHANQSAIYYLTGASYEAVAKSPHLEALTSRGIEVLFLTDPIDEWMVMDYPTHKDLALKSIAKGDLDLREVGTEPAAEVQGAEADPAQLAGFLDLIRTKLAAEIKDVKISKRLRESPACLVADEFSMSAHMEKMLKATNKEYTGSKRILEINAQHPFIKGLAQLQSKGAGTEELGDAVDVLYDTALLSEGTQLTDPGEYARKVTKLLARNLS